MEWKDRFLELAQNIAVCQNFMNENVRLDVNWNIVPTKEKGKVGMIGFYNFSVVLTYIGLGAAVLGMTQACEGNYKFAIICLMLCGICDMFDGRIARAMKRSEDAQKFGIQIDSLCDLVCFGVFPAILGYAFGARGLFGNVCLVVYVLGAVIRLGYFNVMEEKRQKETNECRKEYQGLPVTSAAVIFPLIFLLKDTDKVSFSNLWEITMLFVAFLFILDFKVKKPDKIAVYIFLILAIIVAGRIFFATR